MPYLRSAARTIADLRLILAQLEQHRPAYRVESFDQLRKILGRRIAALSAELRGQPSPTDNRRAA